MTARATRRGLLGFLAGLVPAGFLGREPAEAAARMVPSSPIPAIGDGDVQLMALCREYFQLWNQEWPLIVVMRNEDGETADATYNTCCGLWDAKAVLVDRITLVRARTDAGMWAKAAVTANAIRHRDYDVKGARLDECSAEERLAHSLCRDMGV